MRLITITLAILLLLIQYPLWMGKGGYFRVRELSLQVDAAKDKNEELRLRNARLASEVRDLEVGTEAIEERARYELGMIKKDEIFIQVIDTAKFPVKEKLIEGDITAPETKPAATPPSAASAPVPKPAQKSAGEKTAKPKPAAQGKAAPKKGKSPKNTTASNKR